MSDETKNGMSEDERLVRDCLNAGRDATGSAPITDARWKDAREHNMAFFAKARSLLCPAAEARGRREAFEEMIAFALGTGEPSWVGPRHWAEGQRDACGQAKAEPATEPGEEVCGLTATKAVGVALSIPMKNTTMDECQRLAPGVVKHLVSMGFTVRPSKAEGYDWAERAALLGAEVERLRASCDHWRAVASVNVAAEATALCQRDDLRAEVDRLRKDPTAKNWEMAYDKACCERDDLRAKLAEAERLRCETNVILANAAVDAGGIWGEGEGAHDFVARILREKKAEIARLTRELEWARKTRPCEACYLEDKEQQKVGGHTCETPASQPVTTELDKCFAALWANWWSQSTSKAEKAVRVAAALDQAAAVKAAVEEERARGAEVIAQSDRAVVRQDAGMLAQGRGQGQAAKAETCPKCGVGYEPCYRAERYCIPCQNTTAAKAAVDAIVREDGKLVDGLHKRISELQETLEITARKMEKARAERDANAQAARELEELRGLCKELAVYSVVRRSEPFKPEALARLRLLLHLDQPAENPGDGKGEG